jgi:hypothetical protein
LAQRADEWDVIPLMRTYSDAKRLAELWVEITTSGKGAISGALAKPYGWVFFYNSREFIETRNRRTAWAGNGPFLIERVNFNLKVFGTALPLERYLAEYEKTVPPVVMSWEPEEPAAG